ncbi:MULTISPECIES: hormogonium polysaccharide biosynthesis protein HpsA [unclassified Microcoleus]|uniref:hormogonium polysaccharide biosynthesis protein HpsA n=1 Tax=unclassified Microcoleus TaxID=2642155 RepID=UPI002FCEDB37
MFKSKLSKVIVSLLRRIAGVTRSGAKRLMRAMLQAMMAMGRRANLPVAGFVLPTVTMVLLVVILLTVAITLRSFDRGNMARNVRVNQQVLAAATPAIDRAKAKIQFMLYEDPQRPTATPTDAEMYRIMSAVPAAANQDLYVFGDEERLILKYPVNDGTSLDAVASADPTKPPLETIATGQRESEAINTAWRYPVDTNNDGKFDTFTLYSIFFRTPPRISVGTPQDVGTFSRARQPLDARTPPMSLGALDPACATEDAGNTIASLVGDSGWYKLDGKLKKSFFVYTVNVPIEQEDIAANALPTNQYQAFTGTPSISALEYQQDQSRIPLSNNAVVYEDDLDISPGPPLNLNGRVFTNSNLLVSGLSAARSIRLFEVSSKNSCFYDPENSRIAVAGNVVNGWAGDSTTANPVEVHLFKTKKDPAQPDTASPAIDTTNKSVNENSLQVLYNSDAYSQRLNALVQGQLLADPSPKGVNDPVSVQLMTNPPAGSSNPPLSRPDALQSYFKERLRKVPFAEAALGSDGGVVPGVAYNSYIQGNKDNLRPRNDWSLPTTGTAEQGSAAGSTGLNLRLNQLETTHADGSALPSNANEERLGDRIAVGNNLPAQRWSDQKQKFLGKEPQNVDGGARQRMTQLTKLADIGGTDRGNGWGQAPTTAFQDSFWERAAAQIPRNPLDGIGGLRVITSAGIYDRTNSFLPPPRWTDPGGQKQGPLIAVAAPPANQTYDDPATTTVTEQYPVVWPDTMPMSPLGPGSQVYNNGTGTGSGNWTPWQGAWSSAADISATLPPAEPYTLLPGIALAPTARKFAKGDLQMRASAVYHYANSGFNNPTDPNPDQTPFACVSSYYDPSNASTARNILPLPDVSGQGRQASDPARQMTGLGAQQAFIGSNNGIAYTFPGTAQPPVSRPIANTGLLTGGSAVLEAQANMVFPDGRFANGPLRTALQVAPANRTLAQKAAIDSTNCAIAILSGAAPNPALIPPGAIQEVAFLNGREIKAVDRDDARTAVNEAFTLSSPLPADPQAPAPPAAVLTGNYNQPLEERQPLEIRVTQLDIASLRGQTFTGPNTTAAEWLLPNSGIVYASRDDALPDRSYRAADEATNKRLSPSDSRLDPTRKPNGIMLINGQFLFRGTGNTPRAVTSIGDVVREKGLTLVSNLPVYIKGQFNPHGQTAPLTPGATATFNPVEEFQEIVASDWGNFYTRNKKLNPNFACRAGDPRLLTCGGDYWRPATVLADAVTLLSDNYRFGFRNEGDFDLRNNAGADAVLRRRQRGFFNNNFVTNGLSSGAFSNNGNLVGTPGATGATLTDATYVNPPAPPLPTSGGLPWSSYFNNFVTPVQRRGPFPEYLMEVCTKLPVSECGDADWVVDPLAAAPVSAATAVTANPNYTAPTTTSTFQAGSTVDPPVAALQRFPRRVAFDRSPAAGPQPFGITGGTAIAAAAAPPAVTNGRNSLWFATGASGTRATYDGSTTPYLVNTSATAADTRDGSNTRLPTVTAALPPNAPTPAYAPTVYNGSQPLLFPVLQILNVSTAQSGQQQGNLSVLQTGWIPQAANTTFNLIIGANDTPSRTLNATSGDFNGGLQNLPRFLESWGPNGQFTTNIRGSFIQLNRSAFSTAPYQPILPNNSPAGSITSLFDQLSPAPTNLTIAEQRNYNIATGNRQIPFFNPPTRNWGYDVGLLSQSPDLFTQKFTTPPSITQPAEFFREVPRSDRWVKTLICAVNAKDNKAATSISAKDNCGTFPY